MVAAEKAKARTTSTPKAMDKDGKGDGKQTQGRLIPDEKLERVNAAPVAKDTPKPGEPVSRPSIAGTVVLKVEQKDKPARVTLPFLGEKVQERLPNGWLYPILAAFRANVRWDLKEKKFSWKRSNETVLKAAAEELVGICQQEQRHAEGKPEWVGKKESAYRQCKMLVDLTLQKLTEK